MILGYVSPYERTKDGYASHGRARFALLSAIPAELRSSGARAHAHELERKFGEPEGEPREIAVRDVKSPIEKTAADNMNDDQWLRAISKYNSDGWKHGYDGEVYGGAPQLAQVLQAQVKENPDRFARLSLKFPTDANPVYVERTLDALKNATGASDLKLQVCSKAFAESRGPCGKSIADVLGGVEDPLPDDAVQMLRWLATEHEDPSSEAWQYNGDIYTSGINTARGRAAEAIRELIFTDATYVERFRPTLERMIGDRSASVLSCVAGTLRAVIYHDPALGMALFHRMNLAEDRLLATPHVYEFIRRSLRYSFGELRPTVERMLRSSEPEVCEAGARLASIATLGDKSTEDLVDEALRSSVRHHLGVAQVASGNIAVPECRAWSEAKLIALFNDVDADVRSEAASCFRHLPDEALETCDDLIAAFCSSQAFKENSWSLLHALEHALGRLPGTTCVVCEKYFNRFADEARDAQAGRYGDTYNVAKLVFRTYQQHQNDEWTSRSLDLIDRFCLEGIPGAGRRHTGRRCRHARSGRSLRPVQRFAGLEWHGTPNALSPDHVDWGTDAPATAARRPRGPSPSGRSQESRTPGSLPARPVPLRPVIRQRRSAVAMDGQTRIDRDLFYRMLHKTVASPRQIPFSTLPWTPHIHLAIFVHRVDGLAPGLYMLVRDRTQRSGLEAACTRAASWVRPPGCPEDLYLWCLNQSDTRRTSQAVSCTQDIASDGCFSLGMIAEFERPLGRHGAWFYPRLFWEAGAIGQVLYLEAEAAGIRSTGIGCYFDDAMHDVLGLEDTTYQDLYHFTVGGPVEDTRLTTLPAYPDIQ